MSSSANLASQAQIDRTTKALETSTIHAIVAENGVEARMRLPAILPAGAGLFSSGSVTLNTLDAPEETDESGRYDSVRAKLGKMDPPNPEAREGREGRDGQPHG